ncbi:MAG: hypothetical protein QNL52_03330 [Synechococcus sp. ChBW.bin.23]
MITSAAIKIAQGFDAFSGNDQLFTDLYVIEIANHVVLDGKSMIGLLGWASFASTGDA